MNPIGPTNLDNWTTISSNDMDWIVAKGYEEYIPSSVWEKSEQPEDFRKCQLLKKSILRTSFLLDIDQGRHETIFVKRHHRKNRWDDLRNLLMPSRAFNEWNTLRQFKRLGLPAPEPLAYGEKRCNGLLLESCVVTTAILAAEPISSLVTHADSNNDQNTAQSLVDAVARHIANLHNHGVYYRDLHGGNVLGRFNQQGKVELFFVDTDKARLSKTIRYRNRINDLTLLHVSVFSTNALLWKRFLTLYCAGIGGSSVTENALLAAVDHGARQYVSRRLKSRSKRCLKNSTGFGVEKEARSTLYFCKSVSRSLIDEALNHAHKLVTPLENTAPGQITGKISAGANPVQSFQVIAYTYSVWEQLASFFRMSKAKRAWVNGNALLVRGIETIQPIALYEKRGLVGIKGSVLLMEGTEAKE